MSDKMNTEPLTKAAQGIVMVGDDLREAHSAAIAADERFAEIVILSLLQRARDLEMDIQHALNAATDVD